MTSCKTICPCKIGNLYSPRLMKLSAMDSRQKSNIFAPLAFSLVPCNPNIIFFINRYCRMCFEQFATSNYLSFFPYVFFSSPQIDIVAPGSITIPYNTNYSIGAHGYRGAPIVALGTFTFTYLL